MIWLEMTSASNVKIHAFQKMYSIIQKSLIMYAKSWLFKRSFAERSTIFFVYNDTFRLVCFARQE